MRGQKIIRQWKVLRALEGARRGLTVEELHEMLDEPCSTRTLYRDLEQIGSAGFPVVVNEGRWRVINGSLALPIEPTEVLALMISEDLLAPARDTRLHTPLVELRDKVSASLTPQGRAFVAELRRTAIATVFAPVPTTRPAVLAAVEEAIVEQQRLRIEYAAPGKEPTERVIDPYCTWYAAGRTYVVAWCHEARDTRTFAAQRIRSAEILDETFDPDPMFEPGEFTRRGFGVYHGPIWHVVVDFAPEVAHLIRERQYHYTQRMREIEDGGVRLAMDAAGLPEIAAWVAGFGARATPVAPRELVAAVRRIHEGGLEVLGRSLD